MMLTKTMAIVAAAALAMLFLSVGAANAQATRTWISGVGDDANPCSRTAPCKTFAGAISKTAMGGEIDCLDPGGFGAVTITKSMTLDCEPQSNGSILTSGTAGVVINTASESGSPVVNLIGLEFQGIYRSGSPGTAGVNIVSAAKVSIIDCKFLGFGTGAGAYGGVLVATSAPITVDIINSQIVANNDPGVLVTASAGTVALDIQGSQISDNGSTGIMLKPTGATVTAVLDHTLLSHNTGAGILANATAGSGAITVTVRDSDASGNTGNGFGVFTSGTSDQMMIDSSTASENGTNGISVNGSGGIVRFTRDTITGNATGVSQTAPGVATSYVTNSVDGNATEGTFGTTPQE
jgi:hypothetical protein